MADTIQCVQWALDQQCLLRHPGAEEDIGKSVPSHAIDAIARANFYGRGLGKKQRDGFGVYGDVCVTSHSYGARPGGRKAGLMPKVPASGFIASKEFAPCGGTAALAAMCRACPANAQPATIAQCAGTLEQWPASPETEAQLQGIVSRLGLAAELATCFPATTPLWYGLWAVSPVPTKSLPLLGLLLSEMLEEDRREMELNHRVDQRQIDDFTRTIEAIAVARKTGIALHVELSPLGHTDFGVYTIFPHCPFCKATARTERWQARYPTQLHTCQVCGTRFSPAETSSSKRMKWERDELKDQLGEDGFRRFLGEYLLACGEQPSEIEGIIEATEQKEREFQERRRQIQEEERRKREYLERHVYQGLQRVAAPPSEFPDDEDEDDGDQDGVEKPVAPPYFGPESLSEILRRCEELGIAVTALTHHSRDHTKSRYASPGRKEGTARAIFEKWRAEGCSETFYAACRVPKALLEKEG